MAILKHKIGLQNDVRIYASRQADCTVHWLMIFNKEGGID
jgi:hypothetical protein